MGIDDSAFGLGTLNRNTFGFVNTASGAYALFSNTTGSGNTASGYFALRANTKGYNNTASGDGALVANTTGSDNTASQVNVLEFNTTGRSNIALRVNAGSNIVADSNNIEIGGAGIRDESNTIRIGTNGTQKKTYIAGIYGTPAAGGFPVEVTSSGQLIYVPSAARYKRDIRTASASLMRLRPVSFRYKHDQRELAIRLDSGGGSASVPGTGYPRQRRQGRGRALPGVHRSAAHELQKQERDNKELGQENRELRSR